LSVHRLAQLIYPIVQDEIARHPERAALIGVAGAQGSGKTTVCKLLEAANRPRFAHFSLDDVYFTKGERAQPAKRFDPLFATRGPPGTHAVSLAMSVIEALTEAAPDADTPLPRFDKTSDDRAPEAAWPRFRGRPQAILFDGWCLGALPDDLGAAPINVLEALEDADGRWRAQINRDLTERYQPFYALFDAIIYLRAPNWEIVRKWRGEQERETLGRALTGEEEAALDRFVMHYERITRSMLAGRHMASVVVHLDEARNVVSVEER
jgi:D-glycerate 3-kinase